MDHPKTERAPSVLNFVNLSSSSNKKGISLKSIKAETFYTICIKIKMTNLVFKGQLFKSWLNILACILFFFFLAMLEHSHCPCAVLSPRSTPRRAFTASTSPSSHSGADRSLTPWWSSPASKGQLNFCTSTLCPSQEPTAPSPNSWLSPSLLVTLPEVTAPIQIFKRALKKVIISGLRW